MGLTLIEWAHYTFNPWIGCTKIKPECAHCYAAASDERHLIERVSHWGKDAPRYRTSPSNWKKPLSWNRKAEREGVRYRVFCGSQMDVFEERDDLDAWRDDLWRLIDATPHLDWLLLTKRPENIDDMLPVRWLAKGFRGIPPQVWFGTSAGCQETADAAVPELVKWYGKVSHLFVSAEPLLGATDLRPWIDRLSWVIAGGESGNKARAMDEASVRDLRDQCAARGVPFMYKQKLDGRKKKVSLPLLDGVRHAAFPESVR